MKEKAAIAEMARVGSFIYKHGWAEGNAGNLSYRLEQPFSLRSPKRPACEGELSMAFPSLAGGRFLVTATGSRMRDLVDSPDKGLLVIELLKGGKKWRLLHGSGRPTSEFICHLSIHELCARRFPGMRAVLHVHSPHLIVMSHIAGLFAGRAFSDALSRVHPEAGVLIAQNGIATVPFQVGSTPALAAATRQAMEANELAFWQMHGLVVRAENLEIALDRAEMAERAAELYLMRHSVAPKARGLTDSQLAALRAVFVRKATS